MSTVTVGSANKTQTKTATPKNVAKGPTSLNQASKIQPNTIQASPQEHNTGNNSSQNPNVSKNVPQGYRGIRETLNKRGVADSRIGYNNGYVTIDGQQMYKPEYNIDGTTYADEASINKLTQQAYTMAKDPLIAVRDYVTSKGYGGAVNWDGANPTIGGLPVSATYITDDGIAYMPQTQADRVISEYEKKNNIPTNAGVLDDVDERYGSVQADALKKVLQRDGFSYNPEDDALYKSYKDQYTRNAEEAFRRILNENNTSVTGATGAVLSEALAAQSQELQKLNDKIPELYNDAYNRYLQQDSLNRDDLDIVTKLANDYYNKKYTENRDQIDDTYRSQQAERSEDQRLFENSITKENNEIDKENQELSREAQRIANDANREAYNQLVLENTLSNALRRGFFTKADESILPWLSDYRNADGTYSIHPADAEAEYTKRIKSAEYQAAALYGQL